MKKIKRPIEAIAEQLQVVMKREAVNVIEIGALLIEAKEHLLERKHGEWLPWLATNFGSSVRTADNYMNAARFAEQIGNVSNLKLRRTALFLLGGHLDDDPDDLFSPKAIEAILKVAETEWVNGERANAIAQSLLPPEDDEDDDSEDERREAEERASEEERLRQEAEDILDGPPPVLPQPPPPVPVVTAKFNEIVAAAVRLQTKPMSDFVGYGADYTPDQIRSVINFFEAVYAAMTKQKAA